MSPRYVHPDTLAIAKLVARATHIPLAEAIEDQLELFENEGVSK